jgi:CubicO group peptidase (beta-lactamase class C family)
MITRRDVLKLSAGAAAFAFSRSAGARSAGMMEGPAWRVTGPEAPAALAAFDERVREFMQNQGVSAGQLAVSFQRKLAFNHAYTNGTEHPTVETTNLFRIASCSKIFTCAAIETLRASGQLDMKEPVFPQLGVHAPGVPGQKPPQHINQITVQHLVDHAGGWNDHGECTAKNGQKIPGTNWDPVFGIRKIAHELGLSGLPAKLDLARYMYGQPLQFVPGTQNFDSTGGNSYSNFGYMLLGLVVEKVSGKRYIEFVRSVPLAHDGTSDVFLAHTAARQRLPREVWYEDGGTGLSALFPFKNVIVPNPYGGEGYVTELMDSGGGLATTAGTLARFIEQHATWGLGGRAAGAERSGSMAGTSSYAMSRPNGVDCAFIFNTRNFKNAKAYDNFTNDVRKLCDTKHFG